MITYYIDKGLGCAYMVHCEELVESVTPRVERILAAKVDLEQDEDVVEATGEEAFNHVVKELRLNMRLQNK